MSEIKMFKEAIDSLRNVADLLRRTELLESRVSTLEERPTIACPFCHTGQLLMTMAQGRGAGLEQRYKCQNNACGQSINSDHLDAHLKRVSGKR
jgi:transposase-like protein